MPSYPQDQAGWDAAMQDLGDANRENAQLRDELASGYRCDAWIDGRGQCANQSEFITSFTGAIQVKVQLCAHHYQTEIEFRNGDL